MQLWRKPIKVSEAVFGYLKNDFLFSTNGFGNFFWFGRNLSLLSTLTQTPTVAKSINSNFKQTRTAHSASSKARPRKKETPARLK